MLLRYVVTIILKNQTILWSCLVFCMQINDWHGSCLYKSIKLDSDKYRRDSMSKRWIHSLVCIVVGAIIWFLPIPAGLKPEAWHLLAIFVTTILGFILQPFPVGVVAFLSVTFTIAAGVLKPGEALSGFNNSVIWLIVAAFLFSRGFIKSGLGRRIAFVLIRTFGDSTLKLGYILVVSDLIISPAIPSNTARSGGIIYPIVRSLSSAFASEPGPTARRVGAYLIQTTYQGDLLASAMFMTAMAGNPLIVLLAAKTINVSISWGLWATAAFLPGILSVIVIPYFLYKYYPPEIKKTPEAKVIAEGELNKMGVMSLHEKIVAVVFAAAIILWATSQFTNIDATAVAMLAVSALLITGIITWKDVLEENGAWDTLVWMGSVIGLADYLAKLGIIGAFAKIVGSAIVGVPWVAALILLVLVYVYSHYAFASGTAHIIAMYSAFIAVAVATGIPPYMAALSLGFASSLYQGLTHYASGPSPIFFGAGYMDQATWWRLGFIVSAVAVSIWVGVGALWWKVLGLW